MSSPDEVFAALGDDSEWGDAQPAKRRSKSEKRQRGVVVSVRLNADELAILEKAATDAGLALGTFIRERALASSGAWENLPLNDRRVRSYIAGGGFASQWYTATLVTDDRPRMLNAGS